jgi:hypothetical protein
MQAAATRQPALFWAAFSMRREADEITPDTYAGMDITIDRGWVCMVSPVLRPVGPRTIP